MSLLNAVVGALASAQGGSKGGGAADLLAGVLGGGRSGGGGGLGSLGGLGAMLGGGGAPAAGGGAGGMGALAALLPVVIGMLSNQGGGQASGGGAGLGGLGGLMEKFQQAGLGSQVNSWVSSGPNLPVSGAQLESALGADTIASIGRQAGMAPSQACESMAQLLPELIDRFTPNGQAPAGGLGSAEDLLSALLRR
jgi:uncharacterized protein YidB (DUF937 family)